MKDFNLKLLSDYRSELMGIATIGILMCHAHAYDVSLPFGIEKIFGLGQIGVLLFFFLSGMGLSFSLDKCEYSKSRIIKWYKKRFVRLLIPYFVIYGTALIIQCIDMGGYLYKLSTLSFWFGDGGCWFVAVIIPLYLIAPFWHLLIQNKWSALFCTLIVFIVLSVMDFYLSEYLKQASFFFVGMWLARYVKNGYTIGTKGVMICIVVLLVLLFGYYYWGFGSLLRILFVPFVVFSVIVVDYLKGAVIRQILSSIGSISLESYLLNVTLIIWIDYFDLLHRQLYLYRYIFIVVVGVALSYFVKFITKPIINFLSR